jgi:uncharacterized protein YdeI (YjbR/CyaY-like superfamily)
MTLKAFASCQQFRTWLKKNHRTAKELVVRCFKTRAKDKGLTYREALDEALCFGWIDGVRRAVDEESFSTRFTPRRPKSKWSAVNIRRARELEAEGRMHPAGLAAFAARDTTNSRRYSFEERPRKLDPPSEKALRANSQAFAFFRRQPPWYRRTSIFWVMDAKREGTRTRRLAALIDCSARGEPIKPLAREGGKTPQKQLAADKHSTR